ncbi:MAG: prolyl oligopeptidase family serine peptidase [Ignavibacteriales bacterium]|nr:prolyl oligopeptidase family serine peptidase [Ignavibacteriales bacterium]
MRTIGLSALLLFVTLTSSLMRAQSERPITPDDLWAMERLQAYDVSPDGSTIVFSSTRYHMEKNEGRTAVSVLDVASGEVREILPDASAPVFSPRGDKLAFERDGQIWFAQPDGSEPIQFTAMSGGASGVVFSPDGERALFVSDVYPECETERCNREKDRLKQERKATGVVFDSLLYRHWNRWRGEKRSHLFLIDVRSGEFRDLTLGSTRDVPPVSLGSDDDYGFSHDGAFVAYATNLDPFRPASTNNDVFVVETATVKKGEAPEKTRVSTSEGNDVRPVFSPDGTWLAYQSMATPGFEADKRRLIIQNRETGEEIDLTDGFDKPVYEFLWSPDAKRLYFTAANGVNNSIYRVEVASRKIEPVVEEHYNASIKLSKDGERLYFKRQRADMPYELFVAEAPDFAPRKLTDVNGELLDELALRPIETFTSEGAGGTPVESILLKPPAFDPEKTYPMIFLVHGGPQGRWSDNFHFRWNMEIFAAPGYVVVAPNPRGSVGYGQQFTNEISGDWGGKVFTDLMNAYDAAIERHDFIDGENTFAAGASYGGYMMNWFLGHTDRFNAILCHAGVYNLESMYGATEELWFPEWEFKGTPWTNPEQYEKWSPHKHIHNATTPTLITHGANDFRVPEAEAFQLFTALQRLGVESKLLYFPDEYHFITKPQNAKLWWETIFEWFAAHRKK